MKTKDSIGIIGGADGPTTIFITGNPTIAIISLILIFALIIWVVYLIFTKKSSK